MKRWLVLVALAATAAGAGEPRSTHARPRAHDPRPDGLLEILTYAGAGYDRSAVTLSGTSAEPITCTRTTPQVVVDSVGTKALNLPGLNTAYAFSSNGSNWSATSDLDVRAFVALNDYTPSALAGIVSKWQVIGQTSFALGLEASGALRLYWSPDGTAQTSKTSVGNLTTVVADGQPIHVRATLDVDNGAGASQARFYTSPDGVTWTELGATPTTSAITSVFNGTDQVRIGNYGGGVGFISGLVFSASLRNGINGPVVASFEPNASASAGGSSSFVATTGETWGINGTASVSSQTIRTVPANKCAVKDGNSLASEPIGTNLLLRSAALDDAAWVDANSAPVVTANSWDFGEGSATGETITDSNAASSSGRGQAVSTSTAGFYTFSCHAQSGTLTGLRLGLIVAGGSGTITCNFSDLSTTTQRKACTVNAGAGVTTITPQVLTGSVAADTGSIKVGGCQFEAGAVATAYIPTAGTTASRAATTTTAPKPAELSLTEGCVCFNFTPKWTGTNILAPATQALLYGNAAGTARFGYITSGPNFTAFDGTSTSSILANYTTDERRRYCTRWSATRSCNQDGSAGSCLRVYNVTDGTSHVGSTFAGFPSFDANLGIGNSGTGLLPALGQIDSIVFGRSFGECR